MGDELEQELRLLEQVCDGERPSFDKLWDQNGAAIRARIEERVERDLVERVLANAREVVWQRVPKMNLPKKVQAEWMRLERMKETQGASRPAERPSLFVWLAVNGAVDAFFVPKVRSGDGAAFIRLWTIYEANVRGRIGVKAHRDDVEDILQKTYLLIHDRLQTVDPDSSFRAFLLDKASDARRQFYREKPKGERPVSAVFGRHPDMEQDLGALPAIGLTPSPAYEPPEISFGENVERVTSDSVKDQKEGKLLNDLLSYSPPHHCVVYLLRAGVVVPSMNQLVAPTANCEEPPRARKAGVQAWPPRRIVEKLSDIPLNELAARIEEVYAEESALPPAEVAACFAPLRAALSQPLDKILRYPKSREAYRHLLGRIAGETCLRDYYSGEDVYHWRQDLSQWLSSARRRLLNPGEGER